MSNSFSFVDKDKELIKQIEQYQKEKQLPSFIAAIRELCKCGLDFKKLVK